MVSTDCIFIYNYVLIKVIDDEGSLELYPIIFQVYKHSTLPPSKQSKSSNWSSFLEMFGFLGFRTGTDNPTPSIMGPGLPGDPTQPILPRRVLYYTASFDKRTTIQEVRWCVACFHFPSVCPFRLVNVFKKYSMLNLKTYVFITSVMRTNLSSLMRIVPHLRI